jgi:hypothetical protein
VARVAQAILQNRRTRYILVDDQQS